MLRGVESVGPGRMEVIGLQGRQTSI